MFHLYDGLIKAKVVLNLEIVQWEKVEGFFFKNKFLKKVVTALASHWLLLLRFKCNAFEFTLSHFTMPDDRPQTKHLDISLFYVNKTCRNIIYATTEYSAWTNLFLRKRKKLFKSGFWSLVSVFGCFGVYFFFFLFISCVNTVIPGVLQC